MCEQHENRRRNADSEEDFMILVEETTSAALTACQMIRNGWVNTANALIKDMYEIWGDPGTVHTCFVWAAAAGTFPTVGDEERQVEVLLAASQSLKEEGNELAGEAVLVAGSDQIRAAVQRLSRLASANDVEGFYGELRSVQQEHRHYVAAILMGEATQAFVSQAKNEGDPLWSLAASHFCSLIHGTLPDSENEEG